MKKLLVLVLVLGLASFANAWVLSYAVSDGNVYATAESTDTLTDMYLAMAVDSAAGVLTDFARDPCAPDSAVSFATTPNGDLPSPLESLTGELWNFMATVGPPYVYPLGKWMHATFAFAEGSSSATVYLYEWYEAENTVTYRAEKFIPEPATIALLCLGGLLLRKKK